MRFPYANDWLLDPKIFHAALDDLLERIEVNYDYDIPYFAGYNKAGTIVYIDKDVPKTCKVGTRIITVERYIVLHETVEKALIMDCNLIYQYAHQIAYQAERSAVEADKIDFDKYDKWFKRKLKGIETKPLTNVPKDLDLKPYRDEDDNKLIKRMKEAQ